MEELKMGSKDFSGFKTNTCSSQRPSLLLQSSRAMGIVAWPCKVLQVSSDQSLPQNFSYCSFPRGTASSQAFWWGASSSKVQYTVKEGQITAQCTLSGSLPSLFRSFFIFCCHSALYWQVWCIHSYHPDKTRQQIWEGRFVSALPKPTNACLCFPFSTEVWLAGIYQQLLYRIWVPVQILFSFGSRM